MVLRSTIALAVALTAAAQESNTSLSNPFNSDADVARGEKIFSTQCASCHGPDGRGGAAGPDLSTGSFRRASSDEGLFQIINKGIPGTTMPAFSLNPGPAWQVVAFVRSLGRNRGTQSAAGDATRGKSIFEAQGCAKCHRGAAPDLAGIGRKRTAVELRESILNPQADVPWTYWRIRATTRDGKSITGLRLNEDTFSIQYREPGGALKTVRRADLRSLEYDRSSPMPSFQNKLNETELKDLISYLTGV